MPTDADQEPTQLLRLKDVQPLADLRLLTAIEVDGDLQLFFQSGNRGEAVTYSAAEGVRKLRPGKRLIGVARCEVENRPAVVMLLEGELFQPMEIWLRLASGKEQKLAELTEKPCHRQEIMVTRDAFLFFVTSERNTIRLVSLDRNQGTPTRILPDTWHEYIGFHGERIFVLKDNKIHAHGSDGRKQWTLEIPNGFTAKLWMAGPKHLFIKTTYDDDPVSRLLLVDVQDGRIIDEAAEVLPGNITPINHRYALTTTYISEGPQRGKSQFSQLDMEALTLHSLFVDRVFTAGKSFEIVNSRAIWSDGRQLRSYTPGHDVETLCVLPDGKSFNPRLRDRLKAGNHAVYLFSAGQHVIWQSVSGEVWSLRVDPAAEVKVEPVPAELSRNQRSERVWKPAWRRVELLPGVADIVERLQRAAPSESVT
jgi:hypothetical protein